MEFLLGAFLLGIGIGICNQTAWGMDPFDVMTTGISTRLEINMSVINLCIYLLMCLTAFFLDRKQLSVWTCIAPFVTSFGIDLILKFVPQMSRNTAVFLIYLFGMTLIAFGTAVSIEAGIGKSPYDAFIYGIMNRMGKSYAQIRWVVDGFCLIVGIMIGGSWGVGTVISLLAVGKLMEAFQRMILMIWLIKKGDLCKGSSL